jgi:hypothetical protein
MSNNVTENGNTFINRGMSISLWFIQWYQNVWI